MGSSPLDSFGVFELETASSCWSLLRKTGALERGAMLCLKMNRMRVGKGDEKK